MLKRLDVIILGLMSGRPRTGYDVKKWLDQYGRTVGYSAPTSQIYRQLARLVERGWAEVEAEPRSNGPDAKLYTLTDVGRAAFDEWCASPYAPPARPVSPDFQLRMTFTAHLGPQALLDVVRTELDFRRTQHEVPLPWDTSLVPDDADEETRHWYYETFLLGSQRGRMVASTIITWLESTEARLAYLVEGPPVAPVADAACAPGA